MLSKNIKKYFKFYEEARQESFKKWGYYYPPKDFQEFEAWNDKIFEKHLNKEEENTTKIIKTKLFISLLDTTQEFGYHYAFENNDFRLLNNVIFQNSRQNLLQKAKTAGAYEIYIFDAFAAFASNDFEIIESLFPKEIPHQKGISSQENAVNLLKVLYYKQTDIQAEAIGKAQKYLEKKNTLWDKSVVAYFLAILEKNPQKITEILQELCEAYQKMSHSVISSYNKMQKCFAKEIHGLYHLLHHLDKALFSQVKMPSHDSFFIDFEAWQQENHYPKGECFYFYPEKLSYMNQILRTSLPKMTITEKNHHFYKNKDQFVEDFYKNIEKEL